MATDRLTDQLLDPTGALLLVKGLAPNGDRRRIDPSNVLIQSIGEGSVLVEDRKDTSCVGRLPLAGSLYNLASRQLECTGAILRDE